MLEDDVNFPEVFNIDQKRVYNTSRVLKTGTQAYKHWMAKHDKADLVMMTWMEFYDILYNTLGLMEAHVAHAYYKHQKAKWDPKKHTIVEYTRYFKSLKKTFQPVGEHCLFYQLWRQYPEEKKDKLVGKNKPKKRDEIAKAIKQLNIDC
jgi:hypothetical protein